MGIVLSIAGLVIIGVVISGIYVEDDSQLTLENAQILFNKLLDTYHVWKT